MSSTSWLKWVLCLAVIAPGFVSVSVRGEDCTPIETCGLLAKEVPICSPNQNKSDVVLCLEKSCEAKKLSIQNLIDVHQTAYEVLCGSDDLQEGFKGEKICWFTAVACAKGHVLGDKIDATPEVCYMRKHGISACKCMGGPTCSAVLDTFFNELFETTSCDGARIVADVTVVAMATLYATLRSYL